MAALGFGLGFASGGKFDWFGDCVEGRGEEDMISFVYRRV